MTVNPAEFWTIFGAGLAMGGVAAAVLIHLCRTAPRGEDMWPDNRPEPPPMVRLPPRVTRPPDSNVRLCALYDAAKEPA